MSADTEYLTAMHAAMAGRSLDAGLSEADRVPHLTQLYRELLETCRGLSPAGQLSEAHAEIVFVSEEMLRRLRMATTLGELTAATEDLRDIVERGAAAFRVLQRESDRLGLGLSFR